MSEPRYPTSCVERFLKYVTIDTQSLEDSESFPSTPTQLDLLRLLVEQLQEIGVDDVTMDDFGYVFATLPATTAKKNVPTIGFIAHVDTSPEMPGAGVKPILHRSYDGGTIVLPDDPTATICLEDNPHLREQMGHDH